METQAEPKRDAPAALRETPAEGVQAAPRLEILAMGVLLIVAFWPILISMYGSWFDENAYMEHGVLVLPAAAYMAWAKKDKLKAIPRLPSGWGLLLVTWGALQAVLGIVAQWVWLARMAFLVSLVGCI